MVEGVETKTEIAVVAFPLQSGVEPSGDRGTVFLEEVGNVACSEAVACQSQRGKFDPSLEDPGSSKARPKFAEIMTTCSKEPIDKLIARHLERIERTRVAAA